jgi:hypothetical protein
MSAFSLFTSICPPKNPDALSYLRECLGSWKTAGFDIVAVNGPAECAAMEPLKLPVMWHRLPCDGKPLIGNILAAIRCRPVGFAGIINADCQLIAYPDLEKTSPATCPDAQPSRIGSIATTARLNLCSGDSTRSFSTPPFSHLAISALPSVIRGGTSGSRCHSK